MTSKDQPILNIIIVIYSVSQLVQQTHSILIHETNILTILEIV